MRIVGARGCHLWEEGGRRILDFTSQGGLAGLGHAHPIFHSVMRQQLEQLSYVHHRYDFCTSVTCCGQPLEVSRGALRTTLRKLASTIMDVAAIHTNVSGSAAVMSALKLCKMARVAQNAPASCRNKLMSGEISFPSFAVLSFQNAYHGQLGDAHQLSDTGAAESVGSSTGLLVHRIPPPLPHDPAFDRNSYIAKVRAVLDAMVNEFDWRALAVVFEPMSGHGEEFDAEALREMAREARARGLYIVVDEFKTGQGRTGRHFGCEHVGIRPDAVVFSKILSGGYPCGAIAIAGSVDLSGYETVPDAGTYSETPMACAAMLAVPRILEAEGLIANSERQGRALLDGLRNEIGEARPIRAITGKGLLVCISYRERPAQDLVFKTALAKGLLTFPTGRGWGTPRTVLMPPLTIGTGEIRQALEIIVETVRRLDGPS